VAPERSLVGALAAADAVEQALGLAAQVRWPDAVMVNRREVARVVVHGEQIEARISINEERAELRPGTASLLTTDGVRREPEAIQASFAERLERYVARWREGGLDAVYDVLGARDFLRGRKVAVDGTSGYAVGIDRAGRLEIETGEGRVVVEDGELSYER
jgi:BirA family transcriptional regulator, biotin operon repressor / biotin---[acetyl-CoA-carboxylase] ligase